jgi:3-isopropylmalate/(R)-2-methylmalate dehydratase small subunit
MALEKIVQLTGRAVYVPGDDIDTDRIIPARFMKCVTFDGLGAHLFHDVRFNEDGSKKQHALNDPRFAAAKFLLSNSNFGCGSSREHAPQALAKSGFRAVIAESFAEIFFGNATTLGMPCASVTHEAIVALAAAIEESPTLELVLDLESQTISAGATRFPFSIKPGAREALMLGTWDPIGQLLDSTAAVKAVAGRLPYLHFDGPN